MHRSEEIKEIIGALCEMQGEVLQAGKNSVNPHFKSRYSDLTSVMEALREPMYKNNLCVTQTTWIEKDEVILKTTLMHKSGQWISSDYPIRPVKADPQGMGSAITYARRYSLASLTGLVQADDDGHAASRNHSQKQVQHEKKITGEQGNRIMELIGNDEERYNNIKSFIKSRGYDEIEKIPEELYEKIVKRLEEKKNANN